MEWLIVIGVGGLVWAIIKRAGESDYKAEEHTHGQDDASEGSIWDSNEARYTDATFAIDYVDAFGDRSSREVDVRVFSGTLMTGYCHLRGATRSFRFDRIQRCIDTETGEEIDDTAAFLRARYDASPNKAVDQLISEEMDTILVLYYVGKADGALRAAERSIMVQACHALSGDSRIDDAMLKKMLACFDVPTLSGFDLAVTRLSRQSDDKKRRLIEYVQAMIATQKTIHAAEHEAIAIITKKFGAPPSQTAAAATA